MKLNKPFLVYLINITAAIVVFLILVYFNTIEPQWNKITVQAEIEATKTGVFTVYWPSHRGYYKENQSKSVTYSTGRSTVALTIRSFSKNVPLRIDPMADMETLKILGLQVERFGQHYTLSPNDIYRHLFKSIDTKIALNDQYLIVGSESTDPQLYLQDISLPFPTSYQIVFFVVYLLIWLLALFISGIYYLKNKAHLLPITLLIWSFFLVLVAKVFSFSVSLTIFFSFLFVLTLQHASIRYVLSSRKLCLFSQISSLLVTITFICLIFSPLIKGLSSHAKIVSTDLEILKSFRGKESDSLNDQIAQIFQKIDDYFVRQLPFRKILLNMNATFKIFGLGFSPTPKAILGKNGMFYEGYGERRVEGDETAFFDNVTDYMGLIPFSAEELEAWRICLEERYYWLKERGIDYIFVLAPSKALVYPENLPDSILKTKKALNNPTRYEQLVNYLSEQSTIPFVDLNISLHKAKSEAEKLGLLDERPIYYRTDFHWTYYGAYIAYRAIVDKINYYYQKYNIIPTPLESFTIKINSQWVHYRFISALGLDPLNYQDEKYLTFFPASGSVLGNIGDFDIKGIDDHSLPETVYNNYNGHKIGTRRLENLQGTINTMFVVGDSFSEKYFGFFSAHAQETVNFRTVYSFFPEPYIDYAPDLVIQEVLNMYLLQQPPSNPKEIREARLRAFMQEKRSSSPE